MINKVRKLGEYILDNEGDKNPYDLNTSLESANAILYDFSLAKGRSEFIGINTMQFDLSKNDQLLLKNAPGQKKSDFPTYFIGFNRDESQLKSNIQKSLNKLLITLENNEKINHDLGPFVQSFKKEFEALKERTVEKIDQEKSNICSIRINDKLPGKSEYYQPILDSYRENRDCGFYQKYGSIALGKNNACYVCGRISERTYGFCDTFKFYSSNEAAYISGGFSKELSWKNYPVCPECALHLRLGKEFISNHFDRNFYGNRYFLIPSPMLDTGNFYKMLEVIKEDFRDLSFRQENESNQQLRKEMEEEIFETLSKQKDQATFTFFFYEASQSEFKIIQEAEDILPSRFQKLINAKKHVENFDEFKELKGLYKKNEYHNLLFNFGVVRTFFTSNFNNDFLDITSKMLKGRPISKQFVLHRISDMLSQKFRKQELLYEVRKAFILIKYLYALDLIKNEKARREDEMKNKYEEYFLMHPEFYDADWKKAVFLTGVLAQNVMDIQWQDRGATPFRSRLNGLKIDHRVVKRLLPEAINKLEQYKKNYYRDLEEAISKLMESSGLDLQIQSVDEISFYFALGINLNKQFKSKEKEEGEIHE